MGDAVPEGALARPVAVGESLVHEADLLFAVIVGVLEQPSFPQGDAQSLEIFAGGRRHVVRPQGVTRPDLDAFDGRGIVADAARHWERRGDTYGDHAGLAPQFGQ